VPVVIDGIEIDALCSPSLSDAIDNALIILYDESSESGDDTYDYVE
jgi:hypothetical protein